MVAFTYSKLHLAVAALKDFSLALSSTGFQKWCNFFLKFMFKMIFFDIKPVFTVKNEFFDVILRHEFCDFEWCFLLILEVKYCVLHINITAIML